MISASRKTDAVISVQQDNDNQKIEIQAINAAAGDLMGYDPSALQGADFNKVLPVHIQDSISSYLEYEHAGYDLANVLRRTPKFHILHREGQEIPVQLKVFYVLSEGGNPRFELLLRDISLQERLELMLEELKRTHSEGKYSDLLPGLFNRASMMASAELVTSFVQQHGLSAYFAVFHVDRYNSFAAHYGSEATRSLLSVVAKRCMTSIREGDTVAYMGDGKFAVLLFDCSHENVLGVLNRIKETICKTGFDMLDDEEFCITLSTGYTMLEAGQSVNQVMTKAYSAAERSVTTGGGRIYYGE